MADTLWDPPIAGDDEDVDLSDMPYADDAGVIHHPGMGDDPRVAEREQDRQSSVPRERVFPRTIEPEPGEYVDADGFVSWRMGQDDVDLSDENEVM